MENTKVIKSIKPKKCIDSNVLNVIILLSIILFNSIFYYLIK